MVDKLKPCPFCGSEAIESYGINLEGYVSCSKCRAGADIRVWNTRAETPIEKAAKAVDWDDLQEFKDSYNEYQYEIESQYKQCLDKNDALREQVKDILFIKPQGKRRFEMINPRQADCKAESIIQEIASLSKKNLKELIDADSDLVQILSFLEGKLSNDKGQDEVAGTSGILNDIKHTEITKSEVINRISNAIIRIKNICGI